jgi:hypothetical protein
VSGRERGCIFYFFFLNIQKTERLTR